MSKTLKVGLLMADCEDKDLSVKIKRYIERCDELDIFVAPEYSFFKNEEPLTGQEFERELRELSDKTIGKKNSRIARHFYLV